MRVILSRKGFDSSSGGCPSPVVDGRPISLPIPAKGFSPTCYGDLKAGDFVHDLTQGRLTQQTPCHLDPDLELHARPRAHTDGWRGSLGQESAAQGHLSNQGVEAGDLFLFFGLFRDTFKCDHGWGFRGAPHHAVFGWLQVGEVVHINGNPDPVLDRHPWLAEHPHLHGDWPLQNTLYIAREKLELEGLELPGWGLLRTPWKLTEEGATGPASWRVPAWLDPRQGGTGMTYHPTARWLGGGRVRAAGRGQEFVAQAKNRADVRAWVSELLQA